MYHIPVIVFFLNYKVRWPFIKIRRPSKRVVTSSLRTLSFNLLLKVFFFFVRLTIREVIDPVSNCTASRRLWTSTTFSTSDMSSLWKYTSLKRFIERFFYTKETVFKNNFNNLSELCLSEEQNVDFVWKVFKPFARSV